LTDYQILQTLDDVTEPLKTFITYLPLFTKFLFQETKSLDEIPTTVGLIKPLGFVKYTFVRFLAVILNSKINLVFETFNKTQILPVLLLWFFEFPWNNCLHVAIFQIFDLIWKSPDGFCFSLKKTFIQKEIFLKKKKSWKLFKPPNLFYKSVMSVF